MESCHEYLGCGMRDCIMYGRKDGARCWEVEETLCNHPAIQLARDRIGGKKENTCRRSGCIYYRVAKERGLVGGKVAERQPAYLHQCLSRSHEKPPSPGEASQGGRAAC